MTGKPRILITGGFGNLGSWLSEHFYDQGYHVTILANRVRKLEHVKYEVVQADISNYLELKERLTAEFDYCIHTASYNEHFHENYAEKALRINSLGTRNLIEVLKHGQIKKIVYFSTFHVYGNSYDFIDESSPPSPLNDYASTHLFAEYYLKQFYHTDRFPSVICRLTNSYGAPKSIDSTKWYLVLNDLVKSAYEKGVIKLSSNGEASRDFVWMGDRFGLYRKINL
jgi:nucleoside-diphosphate-sugar epimerase